MKPLHLIIGALLATSALGGEEHWAYQPVKKPALPAVKMTEWARSPVDAFILARLETQGLKPSPPASRETLLRRVTFDLIGLPPTTDELRAFLADRSPGAFEKVVDRLLASPHFGERWGRHWLDTARYADTAGQAKAVVESYRYEGAWAYRDYVIAAYNADKPYDRFILEQLAADRLPLGDDQSALAALGFLTVGERFQNKNDIINDRIDTTAKAFLGLTVSCARCHDHKFDPIPTADYYSLHGIFNSSVEPAERPLITMVRDRALAAEYEAKLAALERKNRDLYFDAVEKMNSEFHQHVAEILLDARTGAGRGGEMRGRAMQMAPAAIEGRMLAGLLTPYMRADDPVWGPWLRFRQMAPADFAARGRTVASEVASGKWNPIIAAQFRGAAPASLADVAALYGAAFVKIDAEAKRYIALKRTASTARVPGFAPGFAQLIETPMTLLPGGTLTTERLRAELGQWPRGLRAIAAFDFEAINELDISHPAAPARAMVMADAPAPADSPILIRGQAQVHGEVVPRRFLEALSGLQRPVFSEGSGRLELARAIASKDNPLTARVLVNRVWMHLLGNGFVPTPDDLGVQSEKPSHPELLDWLASACMESGWSQKRLIRTIVLSNTYQQSSDDHAASAALDAKNRLLWRANIRRLDFEAIRDSLLVFSGQLDARLGGKPINLTEEPYSFRRSVYGYVDRGNLPELMQQFDFSDPDMTSSKRATTVVPQQALFFMNSPMVVDIARKIVARSEFTEASDDTARIAALYRVIFQRAPGREEAKTGLAYVEDLKRTLVHAPKVVDAPAPLHRGGNDFTPGRAPVRNADRRPLSAWEQYAQALLYTNEVVYLN